MVKTTKKDGGTLFTCEQCGFQYREEHQAQECEYACVNHGICRTDIAKQAVKISNESPRD
ncbi:MAG: hypothetical protein AAB776_02370 [Patescibacteria group bacterium]